MITKTLIKKRPLGTLEIRILLLCLAFLLPFQSQAQAEFSLAGLFHDHMVIQRDKPVKVWGKGVPGTKVEVRMGSKKAATTTADDGTWSLEIPAFSDKGPYTITARSDSERVLLQDVLVGDVWIASGQSNMEWPVSGTNFKENDSSWLTNGELRMLKVSPEMDYVPRVESEHYGWKKLNIENLKDFSAVAYHFGKYLNRETDVPIGLISANLGATSIETWMSTQALAEFPQFEIPPKTSFRELEKAFKNNTATWSKEIYYSGKGMQEKWYEESSGPSSGWQPIQVAGNTWENVAELKDFDGAVWFRKKFDLPKGFTGDSLPLQLLQIDDFDITWVNGKKTGETFGRHNHRNYKIAVSDLKPEGNLIAVRVFDAGGIGGFTTNAFWGNELLWGTWEYRKGIEIDSSEFKSPELPNVSPFSSPGVLYNGTIAPLTNLGIKGFIWYQGESNESRAQEYQQLFPALIKDWRHHFDQGNLPFLFVQLANYRQEVEQPAQSQWAELREAQSLALNEPNTGMAVAIDLGEADDIHPKNKEDVGNRLGKLALKIAYNKDVTAESPRFKKMEILGKKAVLSFENMAQGLENRNKYGYVSGFQIAGSDQQFYFAKAALVGNNIHVWSADVKEPVAVRYAWSDNPGILDIYNSADLPLAPFRTDNWKISTDGKVFEKGPRF